MPLDSMKGKLCLVTGGSRTLGSVICNYMANQGCNIVINYHQSETAARKLQQDLTVLGIRAQAIRADVTKFADVNHLVDQAISHFGSIDILVNNVGPYVDTPFLSLPINDFDQIIDGNIRSTFLMCHRVGKIMKEQGHGKIINIGATDYRHRSHSVYGLAKNGVVYITEALALELGPEAQIYTVAPDLIADNEDMNPELVSQAVGGTPMDRLITREEIAQVIFQLCTSAFEMATGATIVLDGGRSIPRITNLQE